MALNMISLKAKLVTLGLVKADDWDAAAAEAGDVDDFVPVLKRLNERFPDDDSAIGERLPILTLYQVDEIVADRIKRLRLGNYLLRERLGGGMGHYRPGIRSRFARRSIGSSPSPKCLASPMR